MPRVVHAAEPEEVANCETASLAAAALSLETVPVVAWDETLDCGLPMQGLELWMGKAEYSVAVSDVGMDI